MTERREVKQRRYKAHAYFPAINHRGEFIMPEHRHLLTRRKCDVYFDDVDLPTMFLGINKQI